jgi:tyrosyl-tRNA synthetase
MGKIADRRGLAERRHAQPYEFWQFWRNTTDADVGRFLKLYTELPVDECDRLGALAGSEINEAKIVLANEVTTLCPRGEAAAAAEATAREVFEKGGAGEDLPTLRSRRRGRRRHLDRAAHRARSGSPKSGKEAKRLIAEGGARGPIPSRPRAPRASDRQRRLTPRRDPPISVATGGPVAQLVRAERS